MENTMKQTLLQGLPELKLALSEEQTDTLCAFGAAVVRQNQVMNLTAITEPAQVAKLHLLDSLSVLSALDLRGKKLIDVGCGAGFPGVPLAIACPEAQVTLLDSLGKRITWLKEILPQLGIQAECVTARAEEAVVSCRESYDIATSRAVARLNILLERGGGPEGQRGERGAGGMRRCHKEAGTAAGGVSGIPGGWGQPRPDCSAEGCPHSEDVSPALRQDQAVAPVKEERI